MHFIYAHRRAEVDGCLVRPRRREAAVRQHDAERLHHAVEGAESVELLRRLYRRLVVGTDGARLRVAMPRLDRLVDEPVQHGAADVRLSRADERLLHRSRSVLAVDSVVL